MDAPQAYTIKSFCTAFGISRSLVYREIAAGRLDARKIGNRTVILRAEAERWASALPGARSVWPLG